jgi:hypothetical protein
MIWRKMLLYNVRFPATARLPFDVMRADFQTLSRRCCYPCTASTKHVRRLAISHVCSALILQGFRVAAGWSTAATQQGFRGPLEATSRCEFYRSD